MTGGAATPANGTAAAGDWDLVVVGAGPAGAAAALGALHERPGMRVLLLDRAGFPRDKACGDGVAPNLLADLAGVGVTGLTDGHQPVHRLRVSREGRVVERTMARPTYVIPRTVLDHRLVTAAVAAGAVLARHRVRRVLPGPDLVLVDGTVRARVLVGADGAHSVVRRTPPPRRALALRGYAPVRPEWAGRQVIAYGAGPQPSYAWAFDRGDGLANVGYGERVSPGRPLTRQRLLDRLERLLPGAGSTGTDWRAAPLPLSGRPHRAGGEPGRVLLAGDAAALVNPMTGEGLHHAVATGLLAGRAAARAIGSGREGHAGTAYQRELAALLAGHQRHTALAARLSALPRVVDAGIAAARSSQACFDDLVEVGLGTGRVTPRLALALARHLTVPWSS